MNKEEIIQIIVNEALPDTCYNADYVETPNSWIIRSDYYAFKIRKTGAGKWRKTFQLLNREKKYA
ncbi:MAG: hypothetical protein HC896_00660 [Bacteroidales bacterium]|nr:hypothetical protein [Bacteroidales bacterium]